MLASAVKPYLHMCRVLAGSGVLLMKGKVTHLLREINAGNDRMERGKNTLKENPTKRRTEGGDGEDVSPPSPALSFAKRSSWVS